VVQGRVLGKDGTSGRTRVRRKRSHHLRGSVTYSVYSLLIVSPFHSGTPSLVTKAERQSDMVCHTYVLTPSQCNTKVRLQAAPDPLQIHVEDLIKTVIKYTNRVVDNARIQFQMHSNRIEPQKVPILRSRK
jgi:hypothetical protein